jgi:class 3 adenylate cyclase
VPDQTSVQRKLAAILAADVVGFSKLIGEDETGTLLREMRRGIVTSSTLFSPSMVGASFKLMGDGLLAEFPSAFQALRAAMGIQKALSRIQPMLDTARDLALLPW